MSYDFDAVEAELQGIEDEFASGRMNAFGTADTQEVFLRELRRIAEMETQVFYRMCTILKHSKEQEHGLLTSMFATTDATTAAASSDSASSSTPTPMAGLARDRHHSSQPQQQPQPQQHDDDSHDDRHGAAGASPSREDSADVDADNNNNNSSSHDGSSSRHAGLADRAFEDVAGHFAELEADFAALGDNLRQLSRHVVALNEMSEQVNNA